jgi:DNA-directed DNA polymerase III PolC
VTSRFVNLNVLSSHSTHAGASSPSDLVSTACEFGHDSIAITDRDSLAGAVPFTKAARDSGIKPIIGVELTDPSNEKIRTILLARNRTGYESISRVITERHLSEDFVYLDALKNLGEGTVIIATEPSILESIHHEIPHENLFAGLIASENKSYLDRNYRIARDAQRLGIKTVLLPSAYGVSDKCWEIHRILSAIGNLTSINRLKEDQHLPMDCCLRHGDDLKRWYERFPSAIEMASEIADMCDFAPSFEKWVFPQYPVPTGETDHEYLSRIAFEGLRRRFRNPDTHARRRLMHELSIIKRLGFSSYFLAVWEVVHLTRQRGIPCIGRGSAANSLVSYCLQLTHVDPIKHDLYFERFLNPWRNVPPDIDIDFSWKKRDEIINWIYERYGRDRVAMISTHVTYRMRSAIREVAKALGIPEQEALKVTDTIPWGWDGSMQKLREYNPSAELPFQQEIWKKTLRVAGQIQGFCQHLSIHCGGIVITPDPITNHVPLQKSGQTGKGLAVTQFEMHAAEAIGLIKIDLLGNRSLGVFTDILSTLKARGIEPDIENQQMVFNDPDTVNMIRTGKTMGCFYIESPAMRSLLEKLHVVDFEGLTAASSVIRPGVAESGMMDEYIKRHNNSSEVTYLHPKMEEILHLTYGVMIYQEDVIRVTHHIAGMTLAEADLLRRAMSGKLRGRKSMREFEDEFVSACVENDIEMPIALEIWRQISSFAGYSFCKGHSASFAILSFQMTYLKVHFPALFMASVMSNFGGFYGLGAYISEARRLGVRVLPPDVNKSVFLHREFDGVIYLGMCVIKNLEQRMVERIITARNESGQFHGLYDFMRRTSITPAQLRILIECGALDSFGEPRNQLLMQSEALLNSRETKRDSKNPNNTEFELFPTYDPSPVMAKASDFNIEKRAEMELKHFGRIVSSHPLEYFLPEIKRLKAIPATEMRKYGQKRVTMVGWMIAHKTIRTRKQGRLMKFLSMEDLTGTFEVTMFPDAHDRFGWQVRTHGPYVIRGTVEMHFDVASMNCETIYLLGEPISSPNGSIPSRFSKKKKPETLHSANI